MGGGAEKGEKGERELRDSCTGGTCKVLPRGCADAGGARKEWLNNAHKQHCGDRTGKG